MGKDRAELIRRSVQIGSRRTSVRLEQAMWDALDEIARRSGRSVSAVCQEIEKNRPPTATFASALRVYLLLHYRSMMVKYQRCLINIPEIGPMN